MSWNYYGWRPYVPVAQRRAKAERELAKLSNKSRALVSPVLLEGRAIARTFWGKAWCDNLEAYSDFANRLPRGRTYVRNGSVVDLQIAQGKVTARVAGSELYRIEIKIKPLAANLWKSIQKECAGKIDSLMELLQSRLSAGVMEIVTRPERGLFPTPREIELDCSCPDWADLCKHLAASLYGVGARLDQKPELLFLLRGVDAADLISRASAAEAVRQSTRVDSAPAMSESELAEVFGIELAPPSATPSPVQVNGQLSVTAPVEIDTADQVQSPVPKPKTKRRKSVLRRLSPAARARIAAALKARWAKFKDQNSKRKRPMPPLQRKMSVAAKPGLSSAITAR
ncbi:MAG TPA: hypothetical protein VEL06_00335 [Haliangiales bacterium]|nr:hypothetical protein [Haliangiales bacterium]